MTVFNSQTIIYLQSYRKWQRTWRGYMCEQYERVIPSHFVYIKRIWFVRCCKTYLIPSKWYHDV